MNDFLKINISQGEARWWQKFLCKERDHRQKDVGTRSDVTRTGSLEVRVRDGAESMQEGPERADCTKNKMVPVPRETSFFFFLNISEQQTRKQYEARI